MEALTVKMCKINDLLNNASGYNKPGGGGGGFSSRSLTGNLARVEHLRQEYKNQNLESIFRSALLNGGGKRRRQRTLKNKKTDPNVTRRRKP